MTEYQPPKWAEVTEKDWPRDRRKTRIIRHGAPDHRGAIFFDRLFWADGHRRYHCAFAVPPAGPDVIDG